MGYGSSITCEFQVDTDDIISQQTDAITEIANEAIAEYDFADKVSEEVEAAVADQLHDLMVDTLKAQPEIVLNALAKAAEQFGDHLKEIAKLQDLLVESQGATLQLAAMTLERNKAAAELKDLGHPAYQNFEVKEQS